jgi:hypothetical protein
MGQSKNNPNSGWLDNRTESFVVIDTGTLCEAAKYPTSFISVQRTISMEFVFENPFASDHIAASRAGHKIPSVVVLESSILFFHSLAPVGISESISARPGQRRQCHSVQSEAGLPIAKFPTGCHAMGVED